MMRAYFLGDGISSGLLALLGFVQGSEKTECISTIIENKTEIIEHKLPLRFSVETYFFILSMIMCSSLISFIILSLTKIGQNVKDESVQLIDENNQTEQIENEGNQTKFWLPRNGLCLLAMFWTCFITYGVLPGLQTYALYSYGWAEGSVVSALRAALDITTERERIYDVIIVGGNLVGLTTAVFLSLKEPSLRIAIVDRGIVININSSSAGTLHQRRFRQIYNEEYLTELANMSVSLWRQLEQLANMSFGSILDTNDGFLFFGDLNSSRSTVEGDLVSIKRTCDNLQMGCEYLNSTELQTRYPTLTLPRNYQGIFHNRSGYINVTMLMMGLFRIIDQNPNIIIRQQEEFLSFRLFDNQSQIVTDRGVLYASRKVLFLPGPYIKNISHLLNFDLNVTLWELPVYYFRRLSTATQLPTWLAFGNHDQQSLFAGFSIDSTSDYIFIEPIFIRNLSNPLIYPWQRTNMIDLFITQKVIEWVSSHMGTLINVSEYYSFNQTYLSTFLPGNGFLLDYVPRTNKRMLIHASTAGSSFVPIWADILSDMLLFETNSSSKYAKYIDYFSLSQPNRLINDLLISNKGYQLTHSLLVLCGLASLVHYLSTLT